MSIVLALSNIDSELFIGSIFFLAAYRRWKNKGKHANKIVTVSAPGKVLIAGGYLVLEQPNVGVTIGATSRFYSSIRSTYLPSPSLSTLSSASSSSVIIIVESPQFYIDYTYKYDCSKDSLENIGKYR